MNIGKSILSKILLSTMMLTMLFVSTLSASASAASLAMSTQENNFIIFNDKLADVTEYNDDDEMTPFADYWGWVKSVLLLFVAASVAEAFLHNAINNGIEAACDSWGDNWGVKQACKIFKP